MIKLLQPTQWTGIYPDGWAGFTWLDWDQSSGAFHPGDDYNYGTWGDADYDRPAYSIGVARVIHTSRSNLPGYGNIVILEITLDRQTIDLIRLKCPKYQIKGDKICVLYAHLNQILVTARQTVAAGQQVATIGKSGTQFAHLHVEIYEPNGELISKPYRFYPIGWSKDRIEQSYLPAFSFIEQVKNYVNPAPIPNADEYVQRMAREIQSIENTITAGEQVGDPQWKAKNTANKAKLTSLAARL